MLEQILWMTIQDICHDTQHFLRDSLEKMEYEDSYSEQYQSEEAMFRMIRDSEKRGKWLRIPADERAEVKALDRVNFAGLTKKQTLVQELYSL